MCRPRELRLFLAPIVRSRSLQGGSFNDETISLATGSFTTPLGINYGLQFDSALGRRGGDLVSGEGN